MSHSLLPSANSPKNTHNRRRSTVQRMVSAQLARMGGTLADTIGENNRQRLLWLGLMALPLLFPVALPGMGSAVGAFCLLTAIGLCTGQSLQLPAWLAKREMNGRIKSLLVATVNRIIHVLARFWRPRLLPLSNKPARLFNGSMLFVAGLSMMVPVPVISFDNVLPALAIVLIAWGLRLRDGVMLLAGYLATVVAVASVMLLLWGGAQVFQHVLSLI